MDLSTVASSLEEGLYSLVVTTGRKVTDSREASDGNSDDHDDKSLENEQDGLNGRVDNEKEIGVVAEEEVEVVDVSAIMADINLIWSNCRLYNHLSDSIVRQADVLQQFWEQSVYHKMEELSHLFPCHKEERGTRTEILMTEEDGSVLPSQDAKETVNDTDSHSTNFINPMYINSLPSYLLLEDKSVKIVLGRVTYDLQLPLAQREIANTNESSAGRFKPSVRSIDLLRMLDETDHRESESSSFSSSSAPRAVYDGLEYTDQNASNHTQVRLHRYPSKSSVLFSRVDLTGTLYSGGVQEFSSSSLGRNSKELPTKNENLEPTISIETLDTDSRDNIKAIELGCLKALESMWELQHNFSSVDLLSTENPSLDCFYTAPCNALLNSGSGSGPSSGKSSGPLKGPSSGPYSESNFNLSDEESVTYEVSVEGTLSSVRQTDMAQYLSDYQWRKISRDLQESVSSSSFSSSSSSSSSSFSSSSSSSSSSSLPLSISQEERSSNVMRSSYQEHISCLAQVKSHNTRPSDILNPSSSTSALDPLKEAAGKVVVSQEDSATQSQEEEIEEEEENESDEDNDEIIDEEDGEEDEEDDENDAFMKECRRVEMETKSSTGSSSGSSSRSIEISQSSCHGSVIEGGNEKNTLQVANQKIDKERSISWHDIGNGLKSSYLRYTLRKRRLEEFVNRDLCGEGGPFDNNCSRSLCSQMALDLLPMLGSMARSETIRDAKYVEMQAVLVTSGDENGCDIGGRRISTRRNSNIVRARFQHLVCATQLSEPVLQSLLVYGFIAGRGSQGDAGM